MGVLEGLDGGLTTGSVGTSTPVWGKKNSRPKW